MSISTYADEIKPDSSEIGYDRSIRGERSLIASILNRCIIDSCLYKYPRHPNKRGFQRLKNIKMKALVIAFMRILSKKRRKNDDILLIMRRFILTDRNFEYISRKITTIEEDLAWEARKFITYDNNMFQTYCDYIDIEPDYLRIKILDYLFLYDNGQAKKISHTYHDKELESIMN